MLIHDFYSNHLLRYSLIICLDVFLFSIIQVDFIGNITDTIASCASDPVHWPGPLAVIPSHRRL